MSVYKRGDIYWVEFQHNGRQIRRSARTESKREAQAYERKLREEASADSKAIEFGLPLKRTFGQADLQGVETEDIGDGPVEVRLLA